MTLALMAVRQENLLFSRAIYFRDIREKVTIAKLNHRESVALNKLIYT